MSRHQPLNGADSMDYDALQADGAQGDPDEYRPRPFRVTLDGYDGERVSTHVNAIGPHDARGLAQDKYPGFTAVKIEEAA